MEALGNYIGSLLGLVLIGSLCVVIGTAMVLLAPLLAIIDNN